MSKTNLDSLVFTFLKEKAYKVIEMHGDDIDKAFVVNKQVSVKEKKFLYNCWLEDFENNRIIIFEARRTRWYLITHVYNVGVLVRGKDRKFIDFEGMFEMGFC